MKIVFQVAFRLFAPESVAYYLKDMPTSQIARITQSVCRCARKARRKRTSCFASFASLVAEVATLRMKICRMHKLDADKFVPCPVPLVAFLLNVSFFCLTFSYALVYVVLPVPSFAPL